MADFLNHNQLSLIVLARFTATTGHEDMQGRGAFKCPLGRECTNTGSVPQCQLGGREMGIRLINLGFQSLCLHHTWAFPFYPQSCDQTLSLARLNLAEAPDCACTTIPFQSGNSFCLDFHGKVPSGLSPRYLLIGVSTLFLAICLEFELNIPKTPNSFPDLPGVIPECFCPIFLYFCCQFSVVWHSVPQFQDTKDEPPTVQAMEVATTKFIIPELEQYWGSVWICLYLNSLSAVFLWQSDLDKAYSNGMFGTGVLVPNGALIFCAFIL